MRIIKPYGRTVLERAGSDSTKRVLTLHPDPARGIAPDNRRDIEVFASKDDQLVIAQWISTIDKIARKPSGSTPATPEQHALRQAIGDAAWRVIERSNLLVGLSAPTSADTLRRLWRFKIAPYEVRPFRGRRGQSPPPLKGRWYHRFAGDFEDVRKVDAAAVAERIHEHLYLSQYQMRADEQVRSEGLIAARAKSIARNTLRLRSGGAVRLKNGGWTEDDQRAYAAAGDVAAEIRADAATCERGGGRSSPRRVGGDVAGEALFRHYGRLFTDDHGGTLSIAKAREEWPGLFNLHMAVKDCYARILKDHKKDLKEHGIHRRRVSLLLPESIAALFRRLDSMLDNRDVNALVRLGKVIHYEASPAQADMPAAVLTNWPTDISQSEYWTSDGQAQIKRNEALVRIWRHALALANRTLTDWADPNGNVARTDIVQGPAKERVLASFDEDSYVRKAALLFGKRASLFIRAGEEQFEKLVLEAAIEGLAQLRHAAFHFKGLGEFVSALTVRRATEDVAVEEAFQRLWLTDWAERSQRIVDAMRGACFDWFFYEEQNRRLAAAFRTAEVAAIPLPRFARVLERADNAWPREGLPKPANRADLENPARLCQYTSLKMLYERPFRAWLVRRDANALNRLIDRAVGRATEAARNLNPTDRDLAEFINAKAASLGRLADDESVGDFFFRLSADSATEMRIQRGYESDAEAAQKNASYIEKLKLDVVALAFHAYLKESGFEFVLRLRSDASLPAVPLGGITDPAVGESAAAPLPWQAELYFLLHLSPVDEIGRLLHQLRKWDILASPGRESKPVGAGEFASAVPLVQSALELYLDMHDAKFEGGEGLVGFEPFRELFDDPRSFDRVFRRDDEGGGARTEDRRVPRRGLREIMRFGDLGPLRPIFAKRPVRYDEVSRYLDAARTESGPVSDIARNQALREALHEKWARRRREFSDADRREYISALRFVSDYRLLASRVTLTDHVRLHRLMMAVLGRLVDYAGLWERDLYFVTLALAYEAGGRPGDIFAPEGLDELREGRIINALRCFRDDDSARAVAKDLGRFFGDVFSKRSSAVGLRNDFAHFNALRATKAGYGAPDLTKCVNDARSLMAYDRKLKNAISGSVAELLRREGLEIHWKTAGHQLSAPQIRARRACHLGTDEIGEDLHGEAYVDMVADLFRGVRTPLPMAGAGKIGRSRVKE